MAVPDFQSLMLPLLELAADGQQHAFVEAVERLAQDFQLSDEDRNERLRSGQTRMYNRVGGSGCIGTVTGVLPEHANRTWLPFCLAIR